MHESPLHCLSAHADHNLTASGILWHDVCDRYACCKRSSGGVLQVSQPVWFHYGAPVCVCWIRRYLSRMSQPLCSAGCGTWIWGAALRAITADRHRGHQWKLVGTGRHAWNDQWKVEGCAHQATVQRCPGCVQSSRLRQWREILCL